MPIPITMPALSPTMTKGHLIVWHKKINDMVNTGDLLLEIETDKAVMEVEATQSGVLDYLAVPGGTNDVAVGTIIAVLRNTTELEGVAKTWLLEKGLGAPNPVVPESVPALASASVDLKEESKSEPVASPALSGQQSVSNHLNSVMGSVKHAVVPTNAVPTNAVSENVVSENVVPTKPSFQPNTNDRVIASPLARKWAEQHGISLHHVQGTGPRGRIVKDDVIAVLNHGPVVTESPRDSGQAFFESRDLVDQGNSFSAAKPQDHADTDDHGITRIPLSGMRKTIAERLTLSKQTVPHFYLTVECCMDGLLSLRNAMNGEKKDLSVNDFMVRACALSLRRVPEMRLMWGDDHYALQHQHVDLAVAVSIPGGLITPIVSCADTKSLRILSVELKSLIARAREGKLSRNEYQGGLFTLTNLGMMGVDQFNPIINPGHTGILAIGATKSRPLVGADGALMVGKTMMATIAADHRVIDGAVAAQFLNTFQNLIQNPMLLVS